MASAVALKILVIDPNGCTSGDLQEEVELLFGNKTDYMLIDKNIDEWEFEFDDGAPYNMYGCSYERAIETLYEQENEHEQEK